jgi:hypothetical protein
MPSHCVIAGREGAEAHQGRGDRRAGHAANSRSACAASGPALITPPPV